MKRSLPIIAMLYLIATYHGFHPQNTFSFMGLILTFLVLWLIYKHPLFTLVFILVYGVAFFSALNCDRTLLSRDGVFIGDIKNVQGKHYLYTKDYKILLDSCDEEGEGLVVYVDFKGVYPNKNIGGFNYANYLKSKGIDGISKTYDIRDGLRTITLKSKIYKHLTTYYSENVASIFCALLLGDPSLMDEKFVDDMRQIQIAHLFSISGFHIALYYGILIKVFHHVPIPQACKAMVMIVILYCYVYFIGLPYSALRAFVMITLHIIATFVNRRYCMLSALSFVVLLCLIINPAIIFSVGFWLSSIAVFAIGAFLWLFKSKHLILNYIFKIMSVPMVIQLVLLPISTYYFHSLHLLSVPINILYGFFFSLAYPISLSLISIPHRIDLLESVWQFFIKTVKVVSEWAYHTRSMPSANILFYFMVLCIITVSYCHRKRKWLVLILFFPILFYCGIQSNYNKLRVTFYDVGQGDCYLIEYKDRSILVDGGPGYLDIKSLLLKNGISKLDYAIVSHNHADHLAGIEKLKEENMVDVIIQKGSHTITVDELSVTIIELITEHVNENNNSLLVDVSFGAFDLIGYGDGESLLEYQMIKKGYTRDIDVLKVAHHGSNTSSSFGILSELTPEVGIIQVGYNYYGLPNGHVLERLRTLDIDLYRMDVDGCVIIESDGKSYQILTGANYGL